MRPLAMLAVFVLGCAVPASHRGDWRLAWSEDLSVLPTQDRDFHFPTICAGLELHLSARSYRTRCPGSAPRSGRVRTTRFARGTWSLRLEAPGADLELHLIAKQYGDRPLSSVQEVPDFRTDDDSGFMPRGGAPPLPRYERHIFERIDTAEGRSRSQR
jgi:hypothetical protein